MAHLDPLLRDRSLHLRRSLVYALLAASISAFIACPLRYLHLLRFVPSILIAVEYLVIVLVAALSGAVAGYGPPSRFADPEVRRDSLRRAAVAIWMAPLILLLSERSPMSGILAAGMVLAGYALLRIPDRESSDATAWFAQPMSVGRPTFPVTQTRAFIRQLTGAILAATFLQAATLANFIHDYEIGLLFFIVGAALLAVRLRDLQSDSGHQVPPAPPRTYLLPNAIMATLVIVICLLPLLGSLGQPANPLDAAIWELLFRPPSPHIAHDFSVRIEQTPIRSHGYIGVILTPRQTKREEATTLSRLDFRTHEPSLMRTMTIPFTGSYWFFQYPFVRPPLDSITAEGDPAAIGVRSSNYKPLLMEAVQNLYQPIETARLGEVQIDMQDADTFPGTISVELVLVDTATWDHPRQSLGIQALTPPTVIESASSSHPENVTFAVPQPAHCREFNQMRLIFRLDRSRSRQAAAIAVQSFVLLPHAM